MVERQAHASSASETASPPTGSFVATLAGCGAIGLWSLLAVCTVLKGPVPPFETTAITFAIGGAVLVLAAAARGKLHLLRPTPASFLLGMYGLFCFHALYFAALRLAPPAEAHLLDSLWSLFIVLLSGLLPGHRLSLRQVAGALLGFVAAGLLVWGRIGATPAGDGAALGFAMALGCAVIWSTYSVASRLFAEVATESLCVAVLASAVLAGILSILFEASVWPQGPVAWGALIVMGLGPVGGAFVLWDLGMKRGNVATLGVLSYASPVLSTVLLVALGLSQASSLLWLACAMMTVAGVIATRP